MRLNNGLEISQIGVGTWTLRGETARQNVRLALESGFRHIDTAQGYENESEVGQGIADSGVPRDEIFITTKVATNITALAAMPSARPTCWCSPTSRPRCTLPSGLSAT